MSCKVIGCSYNEDHTTERHCCGTCKMNGHGQNECGNQNSINKLKEYKNDRIYNWCEIEGCIDSHTHTTNGHSCLYCCTRKIDGNNYIHLKNCPINGTIINDITQDCGETEMKDIKLKRGYYTIKPVEMGCMWVIKCNIESGNMEYLFMHSDCWGQYGDDTSDVPLYNAFIHRYIEFNLR